MTVLTGTCSWTDKTLIACKRFYPRGCSTAEQRLRYYASQFPLVEVDSSYYAMPSIDNAVRWVARTPNDFVFNIKAFRLFTQHQTPVAALPADLQLELPRTAPATLYYRDVPEATRHVLWRRYREAIAPLQAAGKLGLVHFQFPPWLLPDRRGLAHVRHCVQMMAGHTVSVEFRHQSWFDDAHAAGTLALERELGVVHTVVDEPQGGVNSVPAVWEVTHPSMAYLRLHGRNAAAWNAPTTGAPADRVNYDYDDNELALLAAQTRALAARVATTHVVFNNTVEDKGQRNARSLMQLLGTLGPDQG